MVIISIHSNLVKGRMMYISFFTLISEPLVSFILYFLLANNEYL